MQWFADARCTDVTSTSPPVHNDACLSFTSSPAANGNAGGAPFDPVEVVEIKVTGDELDGWVSGA